MGSLFQVVDGWNIETFMDIKGGISHFSCSTKKPHFEAVVTYDYLKNGVVLTWDEGMGQNVTEFAPGEKDIHLILKYVDNAITSRMIQEAFGVREMIKKMSKSEYVVKN